MAKARGLDYSELEKLHKSFKKIDKAEVFEKMLKEFMVKQGIKIVRNAKNRTTVVTGALRASWGLGRDNLQSASGDGSEVDFESTQPDAVEVKGRNYDLTVWNGMEYAAAYEFGRPEINYPAHYPLTLSMDEIYNQMPEQFKVDFEAWVKQMGIPFD